MKYLIFILTICLILFSFENFALARDLVEAASTAQASFTRIGVAALGIGVTVGGILYVMGLGHIGRTVLMGGLVGAVAILGGPAIISLLSKIFGVG